MRAVIAPGTARGTVAAPPSKSMAHRLLICAGLAVLLFHLCVWLTKAVIAAAGKTLLAIKASLMKKEA